MSEAREALLKEIESLSDEQVMKLLELLNTLKIRTNSEELLQNLASNPDFSLPRDFPPYFKKVEPAVGKGIPASQLLIQDRR